MRPTPTGIERTFGEDEIIVSKTDRQGRITYANDVFLRVSGYKESEIIGQPHSVIRHPDMPRAVFALLWKQIESGREIFAYVVNLSKNGDHYWVLAHVTPTFGPDGQIIGYHSNRRTPEQKPLARVKELYRAMLDEERRHSAKADQIQASSGLLGAELTRRGVEYDELVFTL